MTPNEATLAITLIIACQKIVALEHRLATAETAVMKCVETMQVMCEANLAALRGNVIDMEV